MKASRTLLLNLTLSVLLIISVYGCGMKTEPTPSPTVSPTTAPSPTSAKPAFRVIGYATDGAVPFLIQFDKLTHINYAFLIPNEDGTFRPIGNAPMVEQLISQAHANQVKVLVSVGGWGWEKQFDAMAAEPAYRKAFVENLVKIVDETQFDGADIDWEYPEAGQSSQNFLALMQELRAALPKDKLLTAAVVALGQHGEGIPDKSFALMDFVNLMAYDDNSGAGHSSMNYAIASLDYWLGRGLPPEKAVLGVPFYGRGNASWGTEMSYSKIVKSDPAAAQVDLFLTLGLEMNYNGIPTIQAKTRLAMERASGIMFWTLDADATGDLSLLNAIHQVVQEAGN